MRFVMWSERWLWSESPFPAYRCAFGGKRAAALHVKDVRPVTILRVYREDGSVTTPHLLYEGTDFSKAKRVRELYEAEQSAQGYGYHARIEVGHPTLPEGKFKVVTTKKKRTHIVVPGKDATNRCLLFVGYCDENNWAVSLSEKTTGTVLEQCKSEGGSALEVCALLDEGQTVIFASQNFMGECKDLRIYAWNGHEIFPRYQRVKGRAVS